MAEGEARTGHGLKRCNICGWSGDQWQPRFRTRGRLCVCPGCRSLDRSRSLWRALDDYDALKGRLLDVAPSPQLVRRYIDFVDWVGVDRYANRRYSKSGLAILPADLLALPFRDDAFDVVICSHVLEHIDDDRSAINEIRRVTQRAFIQVPHSRGAGTVEFPKRNRHDHVRRYSSDDLTHRLTRSGFHVDRHRYDDAATGGDPLDVFVCT